MTRHTYKPVSKASPTMLETLKQDSAKGTVPKTDLIGVTLKDCHRTIEYAKGNVTRVHYRDR